MSRIADDVVELLDGYQQALADAAIVRGADPDAAWAEALRRANAYWERLDRDLPVTCAECAWLRQARAADGTVVRMCADTMLDVRPDDYCSRGYRKDRGER